MSAPTSCETVLTEATRLEAQKGDLSKAIALLQEHLACHPDCVESYVHLAADSGMLGEFTDAEGYARAGLARDPGSGRARYYLGCALRSQGRLEDALTELERALTQVRRTEARETLSARLGVNLPLSGWNRHVEDDVIALRMHLALHPIRPWHGATQSAPSGGMRTHEHQRLGFALDLPMDWELVTKAPPWQTRMLGRLQGVPLPDSTVVEYTHGKDESVNVCVMQLGADLTPDVTELSFTLDAQDLEFTNLAFGRITVGGREHATARYVAWGGVHSKKYLLVFGGRGFALTAATRDAAQATAREPQWDAIAASFRLLPWAAESAARYIPSTVQDEMIDQLRDEYEIRLERREIFGILYGRAYEAVAEGDFCTARKLLERCLAEQPDHVLAHKELAVVYEKQGDLRRALEQRRAVKRLDPEDAMNEIKLSELVRRLGVRP